MPPTASAWSAKLYPTRASLEAAGSIENAERSQPEDRGTSAAVLCLALSGSPGLAVTCVPFRARLAMDMTDGVIRGINTLSDQKTFS
jgi:hypothetical protein